MLPELPGAIVNTHNLSSTVLRGGSSDDVGLFPSIPPEAQSVLCMAGAMAIHYFAYSFARPTTLSLFTSTSTGFSSKWAFPAAMTLVSPMSLVLLYIYTLILENYGPRKALSITTLGCGSVLSISTGLLFLLGEAQQSFSGLTKAIVGILFVFREAYVQLLTSQMWSFMASVLTPSQSSVWFAPISGLTSLSSAGAGLIVGKLVERVGILGVLGVASASLLFSVMLCQSAYSIASKNGFDPELEHHNEKHGDQFKEGKKPKKQKSPEEPSIIEKAKDVFSRVPVLGALFYEILASQGLSTVLNVLFINKLKSDMPDDSERAGFIGNFYAKSNLYSGILQFGILPYLMRVVQASTMWKVMPSIMVVLTCFQTFFSPISASDGGLSLSLISNSFLVMKTLEFSVRRMLDEMVYVPLDYKSRYIGKEVISVLGYRFGKSGMSLILSTVMSIFENSIGLKELSTFSSFAAGIWFTCSYRLSNLVPTREDAETAHSAMKKKVSR